MECGGGVGQGDVDGRREPVDGARAFLLTLDQPRGIGLRCSQMQGAGYDGITVLEV